MRRSSIARLHGGVAVTLSLVGSLLPSLAGAQAFSSEVARGAIGLTPVIGTSPEVLSFGDLCPGDCRDRQVILWNDAEDPASLLQILELVITPPCTLVDPPSTPLSIPGDGTQVILTIRYCPSGAGPEITALKILSSNALNSPVLVLLDGAGDTPPACDAGWAQHAHTGEPITFDGRGSRDPGGAIVSYRWDFGDGGSSTEAVATHVYDFGGVYTVDLTLTDDCGNTSGCTTSAAVIAENQPPLCDAGGPYSGLAGEQLAMTGAGSLDPDGSIVTYQWSFGDGQSASGVSPSHTYGHQGSFAVVLTVIDDDGASTWCRTNAFIGGDTWAPTCDPGGPYHGIAGQPVTLDGSGSIDPDGKIVSYIWDFGDCTTGTGATPTHVYEVATTYAIELLVTDDDDNPSNCSTEIEVTGSRPRADPSPMKGSAKPRGTGANPNVTLPLHAVPGCHGCAFPVMDCRQNRPDVNVEPDQIYSIYLLANNHSSLAGVQTAFEWPLDWALLGAHFDCAPGQVTAVVPAAPGGPAVGTLSTTFDCVTGGRLALIGQLRLQATTPGCLAQVISDLPLGTHVVDCVGGTNEIIPPESGYRLGRICVGGGGIDACDPLTPVAPTTWGQIKASYR